MRARAAGIPLRFPKLHRRSPTPLPRATSVAAMCRWFPPRVGGVENYLEALYRHCAIPDVVVYAPREEASAQYDATISGFAIRRVGTRHPNSKGSAVAFARSVIPRAARGEIGQIHCGHVLLGTIGLACKALFNTPYVVFTYGSELSRERHRWARGVVLRHASRVITLSQASRELVLGYRVDPSRLIIIHPPVDTTRFAPRSRAASRTRQGLAQSRPVLLTVCRLDATARHKGVDTALRAVSLLRSAMPDVLYLIVGDGNDAGRLKHLSGQLGLEENVRFFGRASDEQLPDIYAAADLFLLPNRRESTGAGFSVEGFGIVLMEAAASGLPVIASRHGGATDAVVDGASGILLDDITAQTVAAAAERLLLTPALRSTMGVFGRARARTEFSPESAGAAMRRVIVDVSHGNEPASPVRGRVRCGA